LHGAGPVDHPCPNALSPIDDAPRAEGPEINPQKRRSHMLLRPTNASPVLMPDMIDDVEVFFFFLPFFLTQQPEFINECGQYLAYLIDVWIEIPLLPLAAATKMSDKPSCKERSRFQQAESLLQNRKPAAPEMLLITGDAPQEE